MGNNNEILYELNCKLTKKEADLLFNSIDYYGTSSILFTGNTSVSKKCKELWLLLNEHCMQISM